MGEVVPHVRKTKRRPSISRRAKILAIICAGLALVLALTGLYLQGQERKREVVAQVASFTPKPAPASDPDAEPKVALQPLPVDPTVLIVGDSFAQGFGAEDEKAQGYAYVLSDLMGWEETTVSGKGGTGFIHGNVGDNRPYLERLRLLAMDEPEFQPDLVILQGSINDFAYSTAEIAAATDSTIFAVRRNWKDAQIVITGPSTYRDGGLIARGYSQSARKNDVVFIPASGIDTWLPNGSDLYAEDGWHPNTLGHQKMAEGLAAAIRAKTAG